MLLCYTKVPVRELENVIERALILGMGKTLVLDPLDSFSLKGGAKAEKTGAMASLDQIMAGHIGLALEKSGGKIHGPGGAAELLKINPSTLRHRMKKLGIVFHKKEKKQG